MYEVERLVDIVERHGVGDHRIDLDLAVHVPIDDARHLGAALGAAERGAAPHPPVTSWNGRVDISWLAPATPMMTLSPQPLWQHSRAWRMVAVLPIHSKL